MVNSILRAKKWHLFFVMFALPLVYQFYIIISLFVALVSHPANVQEAIFEPMKYLLIGSLYTLVGFIVWMWSVGIGLQRLLPEELKLPTGMFKLSLLIPPFSNVFIFGFALQTISDGSPNPLTFIFIFPLHVLSTVCSLYSIYFVARTFKTVELQKKPAFSEYILELLLTWILLVGIWILQPKINKMIEDNSPPD